MSKSLMPDYVPYKPEESIYGIYGRYECKSCGRATSLHADCECTTEDPDGPIQEHKTTNPNLIAMEHRMDAIFAEGKKNAKVRVY